MLQRCTVFVELSSSAFHNILKNEPTSKPPTQGLPARRYQHLSSELSSGCCLSASAPTPDDSSSSISALFVRHFHMTPVLNLWNKLGRVKFTTALEDSSSSISFTKRTLAEVSELDFSILILLPHRVHSKFHFFLRKCSSELPPFERPDALRDGFFCRASGRLSSYLPEQASILVRILLALQMRVIGFLFLEVSSQNQIWNQYP
jgi:hypothetical protein